MESAPLHAVGEHAFPHGSEQISKLAKLMYPPVRIQSYVKSLLHVADGG